MTLLNKFKNEQNRQLQIQAQLAEQSYRAFNGVKQSRENERSGELRKKMNDDLPASSITKEMIQDYQREQEEEDFYEDKGTAYKLSGDKLEDVIKPHMKEEYEKDKYNWFPDETTKELKAYNKRTPGLFKVEFEGKSMYAMCSKLYFVEGENYNKYSCKGIQKNQNEISKDRFHNVLFNNVKDMCINKGFRVINNEMITYIQHKKGLSYYYDKRQVLPDGVSTIPLNI
jgi:hypothetical protein